MSWWKKLHSRTCLSTQEEKISRATISRFWCQTSIHSATPRSSVIRTSRALSCASRTSAISTEMWWVKTAISTVWRYTSSSFCCLSSSKKFTTSKTTSTLLASSTLAKSTTWQTSSRQGNLTKRNTHWMHSGVRSRRKKVMERPLSFVVWWSPLLPSSYSSPLTCRNTTAC